MKNKILAVLFICICFIFASANVFAGGFICKNLGFTSRNIFGGEKIYLLYEITGGEYITQNREWYVNFREENFETNGKCMSVPIENMNTDHPYIIPIPDNQDVIKYYVPGEKYYVHSINYIDRSTDPKYVDGTSSDIYIENFDKVKDIAFTVVENNENLTADDVAILDDDMDFGLNDKINLKLKFDTNKVKSATIILENINNPNLGRSLEIHDVNTNPYVNLAEAQIRNPKFTYGDYRISSISITTTEAGKLNLLSKFYCFDREYYYSKDEYTRDIYNYIYIDKELKFRLVDPNATTNQDNIKTYDENLTADEINIVDDDMKFKLSDKLNLDLKFETDQVQSASVVITNEDNPEELSRSLQVYDLYGNPYVDLAQTQIRNPKFIPGKYKITTLSIQYRAKSNSLDLTSKVYCFDKNLYDSKDEAIKKAYNYSYIDKKFEFELIDNNVIDDELSNEVISETINIYTGQESEEFLKSLSLKDLEADINSKVELTYETTEEVKEMILNFYDATTNEVFMVSVRDLKNSPYFIVPYTTTVGNYELTSVILTDSNGKNRSYRSGKNQVYTSTNLIINNINEFGSDIEISNAKVSDEIINKIKDIDKNITLRVDANDKPLISKEIFEAIKGKNSVLIIKYQGNEWIFNGKDIINPKEIDVSMQIVQTSGLEGKEISKMVDESLLLKYADNGNLPGSTLIRIKAIEEIRKILDSSKIYVYYHNETENGLERVAYSISMTDDGYYEFYINHNSEYIMTTQEVDNQYIIRDDELFEINNEKLGNSSYLGLEEIISLNVYQIIIIILSILVIILIICLFIKSRRNLKNKEINN